MSSSHNFPESVGPGHDPLQAIRRLGRFNHSDGAQRFQRFGDLLAVKLLFASMLSQSPEG